MSNNLAVQILENGLIELGLFGTGNIQRAWRWRLDLLPSYPDVLEHLAEVAASALMDWKIDRLVCTPEALPWATLIALKTHLPLIYSRGQGETPIHDLVGAYDVGHKACLLTHTLSNTAEIQRVIVGGEKTGFITTCVLAIADDGAVWDTVASPSAQALITMHNLAALAPDYLPSAQAKMLLTAYA